VRVLHLTAGNLYGGIENSLLTIARFAPGCPPLEMSVGVCFEGRLSAGLRATSVPVHLLGNVRIRWPWKVWRARRRLSDLLARVRPDVAICHSSWPHVLFAPVVRSRGVPLAFWGHAAYGGRHWLERWSRWTRPDIILANSRFTQSHMGNLFPGVPSVVIHQPVPPLPPIHRQSNRSRIRESLQTPEAAVVIAQTCRVERLKGHGLLLRALGNLANVPGWVCWIAGGVQRPCEEAYFAELRHRAATLGIGERVRFLGQRADVPNILAAADIHCQPNVGPESFGVAFVEALYVGLPVVTTAIGGALEIVDDSCGILVPPGSAEDLAAALLPLIRDSGLRERLGRNGPTRARELSDPVPQLYKIVTALTSIARCPVTA
jgi:glycosyltransferase involved in cell wall biosynthesis